MTTNTKTFTSPTGKQLDREAYIELANQWSHPCVHGHLNCAAWPKGPCVDELLSCDDTTEVV